jgi:signal transduction histidine kinase
VLTPASSRSASSSGARTRPSRIRTSPPRRAGRFDAVVAEAVARARRQSPTVRFTSELEPMTIIGFPERLGRAVNNLLVNAARHSPPGGLVEGTTLTVRDHGLGITQARPGAR